MKTLELKKIVNPNIASMFLYVIIGIVIWVITYVGAFYTVGISFDDLLPKLSNTELIWKNLLSFVLTILNSILLSQLVSRFSFVNTRTFLPVFVFALLIVVWEPAHLTYKSHVALFLFICALFQFFYISENKAPEKLFLGSFLIACASLFINDLIFVIPASWIAFMLLRRFSFRLFLASLLGILVPWILYSVIVYIKTSVFDIQSLFSISFSLGFSMEELQLPTKIYIASLFVVFFISLFGTYTDFYKLANSTRKNINFILMLLVYFIVVFILQENFEGTYFPFIALCFSIFVSNVFSAKKSNFYSILFLIFLCINFAFVVYNFLS